MRVKIKTWDTMKWQYRLDIDGEIRTPGLYFTRKMEKYMPCDRVINVHKRKDGTYEWETPDSSIRYVSEEMIAEYLPDEPEKKNTITVTIGVCLPDEPETLTALKDSVFAAAKNCSAAISRLKEIFPEAFDNTEPDLFNSDQENMELWSDFGIYRIKGYKVGSICYIEDGKLVLCPNVKVPGIFTDDEGRILVRKDSL